ncbi:MAG: hypothetical protein ACPGSD_12935 [Flavobacteriales bacterium]
MNNQKINTFLDEIILDKFIINFIPGLLLVLVSTTQWNIKIGDGITSLLTLTSFSWVLGLILELIFFRESYLKRRDGIIFNNKNKLNLLFGKIGISILISCIFLIDTNWILDVLNIRNNEEIIVNGRYQNKALDEANLAKIRQDIKLIFFVILGVYLFLFYKKRKTNNIED